MNIIREIYKKGLVDKKEASFIEKESKSSGKSEEEIVLEKKIISEEDLFRLKSTLLGIPLKEVSPDNIELKILEIIPEESARYYKMIPISKEGRSFEIGMIYPENLKAREALDFLARQNGIDYNIFLISFNDFEKVLKRYRSLKKEVDKALDEISKKTEKESKKKEDKFLDKVTEEAPISKVVSVILRHAVDGGASDVHIEPVKEKVRVRFRFDGLLYSSLFLPLNVHSAVVSRIKIISGLKIDEKRIPQDGRFTVKLGQNNIDFRVSTLPTSEGEKVVIRILDPGQKKIDFESLGVVGRNLKIIKKTVEKPFGMILSTGPTGSGKTTTLYVVLELLNKEGVNIITLEDPIEYFMEGVNQSQINSEIGYTFASGLRHILRQDPDVLMVGEIRDKETADLAIHAALTGHIVLSTLHTSNSFGVIPRLVDLGVKKFLIPPTLKLVIAQRLVRIVCPYCKKKIDPKPEVKDFMKKELESILPSAIKEIDIPSEFFIYEAQGCTKCKNIGYSGRVGIFEFLEMTERIKGIIFKNPSEAAIKKEAYEQGMITIRQDGIIKVLQGITTMEEVLRATEEQ